MFAELAPIQTKQPTRQPDQDSRIRVQETSNRTLFQFTYNNLMYPGYP